jgi:hypothetical protein
MSIDLQKLDYSLKQISWAIYIFSFLLRTNTKFCDFYFKDTQDKSIFGSDFEFCTISVLVMLKYYGFLRKKMIWIVPYEGRYECSA